MRPTVAAVLVLLLAGVVGFSGLVLWFAHGQMLAHRGAPSPRWSRTALEAGVRFARSASDVYPSVPAPKRDTNPGRPLSEERASAAMKVLLEKGSDHEERSAATSAALRPADDRQPGPARR